MHAQVQKHAGHRHLHQGGEVHEHAKKHRHSIALQVVLPGQGLNPLGPNELAHHAHHKHARHQQQKNLLHKAPRLPQPGLPIVRAQALGVMPHRPQRQRHGQ